ncbi:ribosome assembly protein Rrb1p [Diutina catenulata]
MKRSAEYELSGQNQTAKTAQGDVPRAQATAGEFDDAMGEYDDEIIDEDGDEEEIIELDGNDDDQDAAAVMEADAAQDTQEVYLPHRSKPLGPDEVLQADPSVYEMLHTVNMPWPCLTVDVLPDSLGDERRAYPATVYCATATQAAKAKDNELLMVKLSKLAKTLERDESDDESDDDDDYDPILDSEAVPLRATTNRLRVSPHAAHTGEYLTATMSESGEVLIYDLAPQMKAFDTPGYIVPKPARRPVHTVRCHGNVEGYGLDWSPLVTTGALLSGDCSGRTYYTQRASSGWVSDKTPFVAGDGNQASIEDIQWSQSETTVFATAGCDGFVRIWDTRSKKHAPALSVKASDSDVNVISWCNKITHLLASGHDDGTWGVWDLRHFGQGPAPSPVAHYEFHQSPVTAISFNPLDESVVAVSSEDNTVTLWDLSVEADDEEISQQKAQSAQLRDIPPQLLFVHWQRDVKDVRWHRQIPGALVSTGGEGLNIWKTISV